MLLVKEISEVVCSAVENEPEQETAQRVKLKKIGIKAS